MEAGYRPWSHIEESEVGKVRVFADLGNGNVLCLAGGMAYNSADGKWRMEAVQHLGFSGGETVWTDGTGLARRDFEVVACVGDTMVENDNGEWALFSRDGQVREAYFPGEGRFLYAYADGLLMAQDGPGGRRVFGYDRGRCVVSAGKETAFFAYDGDMITSVTWGDGTKAVFEYENGRLGAIISGGGRLSISYDMKGRVCEFCGKRAEYGRNSTRFGEWIYFFDGAGHCVRAEKGDECRVIKWD